MDEESGSFLKKRAKKRFVPGVHAASGTKGRLAGRRRQGFLLLFLKAEALILLFALVLGQARAAGIHARFAIHDGFDRVVLALPAGATFSAHQDGAILSVQLQGAGPVDGVVSGHRALRLIGGAGSARIVLAAGMAARLYRLGDRLVIDVSPAAPSAAAEKTGPARGVARQAGVAPKTVASKTAASKTVAPKRVAPPAAAAAPAQDALPVVHVPEPGLRPAQLPPQPEPAETAAAAIHLRAPAEALPLALAPSLAAGAAVTVVTQEIGGQGPSILVPMARNVAAAAFRRGGDAHVVFDVAQPLDLGQLKDDPVFGSVTARLLTDGLHLRFHLPPDAQLRLRRVEFGWTISVPPNGLAGLAAIGSSAKAGVLSLSAKDPGRVVTVDDDMTGGRLLVGTQRSDGQRMAAAHRSAEFILPPTWQGVVVDPLADRVMLHATLGGFELRSAAPPGLSMLWQDEAAGSVSEGRAMTRRLDFSDDSAPELHNRLAQAMRDAALSPLPARYEPRMRVAEAMLAEGLDAEAKAVIEAANADDPGHRGDARAAWLTAIAAWLSAKAGGEPAPKLDFDPAVLGESDEAQLWRALFAADGPDAAGPAAAVATSWPLLLAYPRGMRARMLPAAAAVLARGGQEQALAALLAAFPDASLDLARAGALRRQGKLDEALAVLDRISLRPDRLERAEALEEAVEWRLAAHLLDDAAAAEQLGRQFYAWRGAGRELRLRLRVAQLRAKAGSWRTALALLKETDAAFPEAHPQIHDLQVSVIRDLLTGDTASRLRPLDLVSVAEEGEPVLSAEDKDGTLAPLLVDKLLSLDLPDRAEPVLRRLFDRASLPEAKAGLGIRLAELIADRGDHVAALAILSSTAMAALPPAQAERAGLLQARLLAEAGRAEEALTLLAAMPGQKAAFLHAKIREDQRDWAGAAAVLRGWLNAAAAPPPEETILRLARDESEARDMAGLRALRAQFGVRFASGPAAQLFAVLTAEPVQGVFDLPRAGQELAAIRSLPGALQPR
jgi:hypothetical protein